MIITYKYTRLHTHAPKYKQNSCIYTHRHSGSVHTVTHAEHTVLTNTDSAH